MTDPIARLLGELRACASSRDASRVLLAALVREVERVLDDAPRRGRVEQAALHLHVGDGFRSLVRLFEPMPDLPASRTAWGTLREREEVVLLDVATRHITGSGGTDRALPRDVPRHGTLTRLAETRVTHLLAIPVRAVGALRGMASVELAWPAAAGQPLPGLLALSDLLRSMAEIATMSLLLLPPASASDSADGVLAQAELLAPGDDPVLLVGEPGTGKAHVARWIHERTRPDAPWSSLVCEGLAIGRLDEALSGGGTVLLRHVEALSEPLQRRVLVALDTGGPRFIFTSTGTLLARPRFSPELAARLRGWGLSIPALRERRHEIPALAQAYLAELGPGPSLSSDALDVLERGEYAENFHTLRAVVHRARGFARSERIVGGDVRRAFAHLDAGLGVVGAMRPGARALLDWMRASEPATGPRLGLADGFAGLVVAEGLDAGLDPHALAEVLGIGRSKGNHLKTMRLATDALERLCAAVGEPAPVTIPGTAPRTR